MILCIGEILADMIGEVNGKKVKYERKAGGAPFNVACGLKKFGCDVKFCGSVGDDLIGNFLIDFANEFGLDTENIKKCKDKNTTLAFVELNEEGERSFCFYRKNTADYDMPPVSNELIEKVDTVVVGSLMLADEKCVDYALDIIDRAHALGKRVAFDVNFRTDVFRSLTHAIKTYKTVLEKADIVKFSEDEVEIFGRDYIESALKEKLVLISLGGAGSEWRYFGKSERVPSISVKPIDTTGAGDAFFAGVLSRLDKESEFSEKIFSKALRFGNISGALNTLGKGAIDNLPDIETIKNYL
ncbi:MAG: carbohydrate kinase [Clostridia bacterium]|nr:carbohydrate kinase [Clostridia bacterium]